MEIYIKGVEMPKDGSWKTVRIYSDGTCAVPNWQGDCTLIKGAQAVPVPPHGRLIDADACEDYFYEHLSDLGMAGAMNAINEMPTIIPAEEG